MNFEDVSKWGKSGNGSKQLSGYNGYKDPEDFVAVNINTNANYVLEGDFSIVLTPQTRWFDFKLKGLKPNTKYALSFSYATNKMKASTGGESDVILSKYGIFNYAAVDANLEGATSTNNYSAFGFLHFIHSKLFTIMNEDGVGSSAYSNSSVRCVTDGSSKGIAEVANTWYNTILYFNSGSVSDTLALVIFSECEKTYLDNFKLVEVEDDIVYQDYYAPTLNDKSPSGSYKSEKATTTLYENITKTDFESYKSTLADEGFSKYAENCYGDNKFAIYTKGNTTVNITYNPYNSTLLVAEQVTDALPVLADDNIYTGKEYQPLIIQLDHNNATGGGIGMSYIIRLNDGSFIIVDGGHSESYFDNANRLYQTLRKYTPNGKIQIAAWLLTHCHGDHISGFMSFIERYRAQIDIEQVIYNFASLNQYAKTGNEVSLWGYESFELMKAYIKFMPNAKISTCHSGYKYHIRNAIIDVMFTLEDIYPKVVGNDFNDINETCTTYKISFADEDVNQTLLITGDSANNQCSEMLKKYSGDELKSTFVQAIHHGIYYGYYDLYSKMNPEVVLFPASANRLMNVLYQNQNSYFVKEDSVKEVVCSDYGTRVFALPYTPPEGLTELSKFTIPSEFDPSNPLNRYLGVSIRKAGEGEDSNKKQAIRFKFQIPNHIIKTHTEDGFFVEEYGMLIGEEGALLDYFEGNKTFVTDNNGKKVYKGVAYNKTENINIVFGYENYRDATGDLLRSTQYTCALYNIGLSGSSTDFNKYDKVFKVCSYIKFKNPNSNLKIYYGDVQSASVFSVMQEILKSTNTEDVTYVKNFLDGKIKGFEDEAAEIKTTWLKNSDRATLYTPSN